MNKLAMLFGFSILLLIPTGAQSAFGIIIDDFLTSQSVSNVGAGGSFSSVSGSGILGGNRDVEVQGTSSVIINSGQLTFSKDTGSGNNAMISYDGSENTFLHVTLGLGSIDLTSNNHDRFLLNIKSNTCGTLGIEVFSNQGTVKSYHTSVAPTVGITEIKFSDFPIGSNNVNDIFSKIGSLRLTFFNSPPSLPCTLELTDFRTGTASNSVVGGEIIPIESTSLILAGIHSITPLMIPVIAGIGAVAILKFRGKF